GNEDFRREAEFHPVETCLGNADDGHFVIIQSESLTDDLGITGETRLPEVVVENNEGMATRDFIIFRSEDAPHSGGDAESGEVGAGNEFHGDAFGLLADGKAGGSREAAKHVGEDIVVVAKISEHGMGNGVAAPVVAIVPSSHGEEDELLRSLDGQEAQQNLVEEGENGGVCADAEGQSQNGHGREARSASEHAEGVLQVAQDGVKPAAEIHGPSGRSGSFGHRNTLVKLEVKTKNLTKSSVKVRRDSWMLGRGL